MLQPGHLGTRGAFTRDFVTHGNPRLPKSPERLRELLSEVMIRNTRALVDVRLPPRFVRTVRVEPKGGERTFYEAISTYIRERSNPNPGRQRPLLLTLLAEAGSSPAAVLSTLDAQLARGDLPPEIEQKTRALQVSCAQVGETAKAGVLLDLLAEAQDDKTAVFVKYRATLAMLEGLLAVRGIPAVVFHGGLRPKKKRP